MRRPYWLLPLVVGIGGLLISGCTIVGHEQVSGWPQLQVREHYVAHSVMRDKCVKYVGFGMSPDACMEFNLIAGTCDIWFSTDFPPGQREIEHERLHCRGYDHIGGDVMKRAVAAWRSYMASQSASQATSLTQSSSQPQSPSSSQPQMSRAASAERFVGETEPAVR